MRFVASGSTGWVRSLTTAGAAGSSSGVLLNVELRIRRGGLAATAGLVVVFVLLAFWSDGGCFFHRPAMRLVMIEPVLLRLELLRDGGWLDVGVEPPFDLSDALLWDRIGTLGVLGERKKPMPLGVLGVLRRF